MDDICSDYKQVENITETSWEAHTGNVHFGLVV